MDGLNVESKEPHCFETKSINIAPGQDVGMMNPPIRQHAIENDFINYALDFCKKTGYNMEFRPVNYLLLPMKMAGGFCHKDKKLTVAIKHEGWFEVFLHEFSHLQQSIEKLWITEGEEQHFDLFPQWLAGKIELSPSKLETSTRTIQECELDAERRAVKSIKKYKFPSINLEYYIRTANVYILMHEAARITRRWSNKCLWENHGMNDLVPKTLIRRIDKLPPKFLDTYISKC